MRQNKWTREETIVAFNVYCKIPFAKSSKSNPTVIEYAHLLGRSPSALNMKIGNIGRLDPSLRENGIVGLSHGSKMEEEVWKEFRESPENFIHESEKVIRRLAKSKGIDKVPYTETLPKGEEQERVVRVRVNQKFFREAVLSAYNNRCCISGVGHSSLLEACHIVDWASHPTERTNPSNGLCLSSFFHKAYDGNLLAITPDYEIILSEALLDTTSDGAFKVYLKEINGSKISIPDKFLPDRDLLALHYEGYIKEGV